MLGIVAAGGSGTRMLPITKYINKHLISCDKETLMIDYPLQFMKKNGFDDIVVVTGSSHASQIVDYVADGNKYGFKRVEYAFQPKPAGIADVLKRVSHHDVSDGVMLILGDNYFGNFEIPILAKNFATSFEYDIKDINKAKAFGQIVGSWDDKTIDIIEKPQNPTHSRILTGLYVFPADVFDVVESLNPSSRNELEITDLLKIYLKRDQLQTIVINGEWADLGEWESLKKFWKSRSDL